MGEKSTLNAKLNKHFAALGAAAAAITGVGIAQQAEATIVYSGVVNIPVANNIDGVYLNVVTNTSGAPGAAVVGWDINPYQSSATGPAMSFFTATAAGPTTSRGYVAATTTGAALNLASGTPINAASVYNTGIAAGTNFAAGSGPGVIGFRFQNEANANAVHYGWARIDRSSPPAGSIGVIVDYAYEDVAGGSIPAGVVPEPASLGLLALGAMGLVARRR